MKVSKLVKQGLWACLFISSVGLADPMGPNPDEVTINAIHYGGTGCPVGSVDSFISPDAQAFTLFFGEYIAEMGPGIPRSESRKVCNIAVDLRFPQGWSFSIYKVDYRGFASLTPGTYGIQSTLYRFSGTSSGSVRLSSFLRGPKNEDYTIQDRIGIDALVWSPCGAIRPVIMQTQVRVGGRRNSEAFMTLDSIDGEVQHIYGIKWRRCY